jgi:2-polyprenyl-6-methoxyphenol hydroxylase-like FAD-dependent oxidoreductase
VGERRGHAVVCGASMAGLLAARVLSEFFESVTLVERDELSDAVAQRRGVAQGRHLHMLLSVGASYLQRWFPGLFDDLAGAGAQVLNGVDPSSIVFTIGEHELCRSGTFGRPEDMVVLLASRPLLETLVRRRVRAIGNVTLLDRHDVSTPVIDADGRVAGARATDRVTGLERLLEADLVVDATGRSARTPAFLEAHGYPRPAETKYTVHLNYSSQFFHVPSGLLAEKVVVASPTRENTSGAGFLTYEDDTAILTLIGYDGRRLPTELPDVLEFAAEFVPPRVSDALRSAEPLGEVSAQHYPASVWRRYDELRRFPMGLLVIGDALCSFNPVYGQGMTSAALQAAVLQRCLSDDATGDLGERYFRSVARRLQPIWRSNRLNDFAILPAHGWRAAGQRVVNWSMEKLWAAAATDVVITEAALRMVQMLDPPTALMRPAMLRRVVVGNYRATKTTSPPTASRR